MMTNTSIKSKKRVQDHGEVFTPDFIVSDMLELVQQETERIDSRFLEPACGTGNFLIAILNRKLDIVKNRYKKSQLEYERFSIIAIASIYGIDILEDNVEECRKRLFDIFETEYKKIFKDKCKLECFESIKYVLERNILIGDALTLKTVNGERPIVFSEWSAINGTMIKRRDYTLEKLLENQSENKSTDMPNLFSDMGDKAFIPEPIAEFPPMHFLKLRESHE